MAIDPNQLAAWRRNYEQANTPFTLGGLCMVALPQLLDEVEALQAAIAKHHAQRNNDKCWLNDNELYQAAGLEFHHGTNIEPDEFLSNCERYAAGIYGQVACQVIERFRTLRIEALQRRVAELEGRYDPD